MSRAPGPRRDADGLSAAVMEFLSSPAARVDPYPLFARLHREEPVHRSATGAWLCVGHADVVRLLGDPRTSVVPRHAGGPTPLCQSPRINDHLVGMLSMRDPPDHGRLRRLVGRAFTPHAIQRARPLVEAIVDGMVGPLLDAGRCDVIGDVGRDLPVEVTCALLGIPPDERPRVLGWTEVLTEQIAVFGRTPAEIREAEASVAAFAEYVARLTADRLRRPADDDLLTALATAGRDGERLTRDEMVSAIMLLFMAGRETVTNMIGNTVFTLLRHPHQLRCVRDHPALSRGAIEECLRFESPVRLGARTATADIPIRDRLIRAGDVVLAVFAGANRDPALFPHPDWLDVRRTDNRHLAFGHGIHFCLGHALARLEGEVFLDRFLRRTSAMELGPEPPDRLWSDSLPFRGVRALPIRFRAA